MRKSPKKSSRVRKSVKSPKKSPCKKGWVINPLTGRCIMKFKQEYEYCTCHDIPNAVKVNKHIEENCINHNFIYFNPFVFYTREDGTLKYELSDNCVHLGNNLFF